MKVNVEVEYGAETKPLVLPTIDKWQYFFQEAVRDALVDIQTRVERIEKKLSETDKDKQ